MTRDVERWDAAPAPDQIGRKLIAAVTGADPPVERAAAISNTSIGPKSRPGLRRTRWCSAARRGGRSGAGRGGVRLGLHHLPLAGVYEPIWNYDATTLAKDLSAHLIFGQVADGALRALTCETF